MDAQLFSTGVSALVLASQLAFVGLVLLLFRYYRVGSRDGVTAWVHRNGLTLAFLVAAGATAASFVFSDVIGWTPCTLCWYQRAFMVPLAFILGVAAWRRDRSIIPYAVVLAAAGGLVALNHVWLQSAGTSFIPCPAPAPGAPSCDQRFVYEFGYLTIPVMSLTAFALVGVLLGHAQTRKS